MLNHGWIVEAHDRVVLSSHLGALWEQSSLIVYSQIYKGFHVFSVGRRGELKCPTLKEGHSHFVIILVEEILNLSELPLVRFGFVVNSAGA